MTKKEFEKLNTAFEAKTEASVAEMRAKGASAQDISWYKFLGNMLGMAEVV